VPRLAQWTPSEARRCRAFTLIELLVVIAIIAVLFSITVSVLGSMRAKGNSAKTASDLRQIGVLLLAYASDHDGATPTAGGVVRYGETDAITGLPSWQEQLEVSGKIDRKLFAGPDPVRLASGEWQSRYFLGSQAAYAATGGFSPVRLQNIERPGKYLLAGEVRRYSLFQVDDSDQDNYTQDPVFDSEGAASPPAQLFFADGHCALYKTRLAGDVVTTYDGSPPPDP